MNAVAVVWLFDKRLHRDGSGPSEENVTIVLTDYQNHSGKCLHVLTLVWGELDLKVFPTSLTCPVVKQDVVWDWHFRESQKLFQAVAERVQTHSVKEALKVQGKVSARLVVPDQVTAHEPEQTLFLLDLWSSYKWSWSCYRLQQNSPNRWCTTPHQEDVQM
jgi:hypothetical protein